MIRTEVERTGRLTRPEVVTALIIATAVVVWAAQPWHGVPPEAIGMVALGALFATRVLISAEIATGTPWALAILVGAMLGLTAAMSTYRIDVWMAGYIVPTLEPFVDSPAQLIVALSLAVAAMRFAEPVGFITIAAFFLALSAFVAQRGIPPLVLTATIVFPVHVFWFNYQNAWIVMTEGISNKSAYTDADRMKLATAFLGVTIVALWLSLLYWRALWTHLTRAYRKNLTELAPIAFIFSCCSQGSERNAHQFENR